MTEIFGWPDAELHMWTGLHTASGNPVAYVENVNATLNRSWQSRPAVDGTYRAHVSDRRADFSFVVGWVQGATLTTLFELETAVHVKLTNINPGLGSAGILLYSGVLPSLGMNGAAAGTFGQSVNGFAHSWSAF